MVRRVFTIACVLLWLVALAGCVDLAPQDGVFNRDDGLVTIVAVQTDTEHGDEAIKVRPDITKGDEVTKTQSNTELNFDPTESRQISTPPSNIQAGGPADKPPKSPETTVQDAAPAAAMTPISPVAAPAHEKPTVDDNPERLMGLGAGELTIMLGSPRFIRRDSLAQLWRYRNKSCILDLFLYRNAGRREYFVNHIEARRAEGGAALKRKCFGALLLQQRVREAS